MSLEDKGTRPNKEQGGRRETTRRIDRLTAQRQQLIGLLTGAATLDVSKAEADIRSRLKVGSIMINLRDANEVDERREVNIALILTTSKTLEGTDFILPKSEDVKDIIDLNEVISLVASSIIPDFAMVVAIPEGDFTPDNMYVRSAESLFGQLADWQSIASLNETQLKKSITFLNRGIHASPDGFRQAEDMRILLSTPSGLQSLDQCSDILALADNATLVQVITEKLSQTHSPLAGILQNATGRIFEKLKPKGLA